MGDVTRPGDNPAGMLRDLAAKATPGPWHYNETNHIVFDGAPDRVAFVELDADLPLIALAPDLAVLCADMADYVEHMEKHWGGGIAGSGPLLARFAALVAPEERTT